MILAVFAYDVKEDSGNLVDSRKNSILYSKFTKMSDVIQLKYSSETLTGVDRLIVNTGNRPNFSFHRELCYEAESIMEAVRALPPLIDPNEYNCDTC